MDGRIVLNGAEQRRVTVLNHLDSGALVNSEAAALLGISVRQVQRLHSAYRDHGVAGLAHGNRDRPAHNAIDAAIAARVVELAKDKYQGFNHQHLTEMLAENDGIELSHPTVRRVLLEYGGVKVAKVTTSGSFTEYTLTTTPVVTADYAPGSITAGPDGNLWFTEVFPNKVARLTTSGSLTEYAIPTAVQLSSPTPATNCPAVIAAGPDSNIWFTESCGNKVAKVVLAR